MRVESLDWSSPDSEEALLLVTDGVSTVKVFSHPHVLTPGQQIHEPLVGFGAERVELAQEGDTPGFDKLQDPLAYRIVGRLEDVGHRIFEVGGFRIRILEPLPGDLKTGDLVAFSCERIEVA